VDDPTAIEHLLAQRYFAETAYYGGVLATASPSAQAHMLAGAGCCGCAEPLAAAQRLLDGDPDPPHAGDGAGGLRVSPATELPYEGLGHLIAAVSLDPALRAPERLHDVLDGVADDLAYVSRREIHRPPDARRRYSHGLACVAAALLLRRLTGSGRDLPRVAQSTVERAREVIAEELSGRAAP
jgi:hypothetical protein